MLAGRSRSNGVVHIGGAPGYSALQASIEVAPTAPLPLLTPGANGAGASVCAMVSA
jgi:hypothetical protein